MKPGLSDRLSRLKKTQKDISSAGYMNQRNSHSGGESADRTIPATLSDDWKVLEKDLWYRERRCPSPLTNFKSSGLLVENYPPRDTWLFYDTETTGLSGGAGNIAFLVGLGREEGDEFVISQYFLRDYPGEPALLEHLKTQIESSRLFISYNGKSFDKPLIETRFLMNRIGCRMGAQLDLLYPVRTFFRDAMPNCRLGTVEEMLLDIYRKDDIPGAQIPDIWFDFLKTGDHPDLDRVMHHNDMDIHSLALLLVTLENCIMEPELQPLMASFSLGRYLLDRGEEKRGLRLLQDAAAGGDSRAEIALSLYWKRRGDWKKALELWDSILDKRLSPYAAIEKAKYYEHRIRDISGALELTESLLTGLPLHPELRKELIHRRGRLERKLKQNIAGTGSDAVQ